MAALAPQVLCGLTRYSELWFDDGSIIIRAENTLFKVYQGTLMQQSELFHDLLTLPQPVDAETIDGCPVVWLEGMSAREVGLFLLCLHNPAEYHRTMEDFEEIALLLHICHKYVATNLEERIISHLSPMFPHTLERFLFSEKADKKVSAPFDYTSLACTIRIANVAREIGALHLLPAALYRLCRYTPDLLIDSALSPDNLCAVMAGRSRLSLFARRATYKHLFVDAPSQTGRVCCREARLKLSIQLCHADGWLDPLAPREAWEYRNLCHECTRLLLQATKEGRLRAWKWLPEFFALPKSTWSCVVNDKSVELYGAHSDFTSRTLDPEERGTQYKRLFVGVGALAFVGGILWYYDCLPRFFSRKESPPPSTLAALWAQSSPRIVLRS